MGRVKQDERESNCGYKVRLSDLPNIDMSPVAASLGARSTYFRSISTNRSKPGIPRSSNLSIILTFISTLILVPAQPGTLRRVEPLPKVKLPSSAPVEESLAGQSSLISNSQHDFCILMLLLLLLFLASTSRPIPSHPIPCRPVSACARFPLHPTVTQPHVAPADAPKAKTKRAQSSASLKRKKKLQEKAEEFSGRLQKKRGESQGRKEKKSKVKKMWD